MLDVGDLRALGQQFIKNRWDPFTEITASAQEHFHKLLSVHIHKFSFFLKKTPTYGLYVNIIQKHCYLLCANPHLKCTQARMLGKSKFEVLFGKMNTASHN